jgi:hypothetical protein
VSGLDAHPTRVDTVLCRELDGGAVLLEMATGRYYSLNPVGCAVWRRLDGSATMADLVAHVCGAYAVAEDEARADVAALLADLAGEGLVRLDPGAPGGAVAA